VARVLRGSARNPDRHGEGEEFSLGRVEIAPMRRRHLRAVLAIEEQIFPTPWTYGLYASEVAQPSTRTYLVARIGHEVIGYGGCVLVVGEGHITTIGVKPSYQHLGIGRLMLWSLATNARGRGAFALTLEVRVSNERAQALYREFGFAPAGIRKGYYLESGEDAIIMWAYDIDRPEYQARLDTIAERIGRRQ
jgi:ribosomal-protein-alanine N-acetyltransferase